MSSSLLDICSCTLFNFGGLGCEIDGRGNELSVTGLYFLRSPQCLLPVFSDRRLVDNMPNLFSGFRLSKGMTVRRIIDEFDK
jgi:hypothetical protein